MSLHLKSTRRLTYERLDIIVGSVFAVFIAAFIMIACAATLFKLRIPIESAKDAAIALGPLAGKYASTLFAIGLLNASLFSAAILPLSTAYTVCEAFGWESGLQREFNEAPVFFAIYTSFIVLGSAIILLPIQSLIQTMIVSQTFNGLLMPIILVVMLILINDQKLMGIFKNGRVFNWFSWIMAIILIILAVFLVIITLIPGLIGQTPTKLHLKSKSQMGCVFSRIQSIQTNPAKPGKRLEPYHSKRQA
jgi:Mn2+/Fe2+ NRAMP family transporter